MVFVLKIIQFMSSMVVFHQCPHSNCFVSKKVKNDEWLKNRMKVVANKDIIKYAFLSEKGYTVVQIAECEFISKIKPHCNELYSKYLPDYYRSNRGSLSFSKICEDIKSNK